MTNPHFLWCPESLALFEIERCEMAVTFDVESLRSFPQSLRLKKTKLHLLLCPIYPELLNFEHGEELVTSDMQRNLGHGVHLLLKLVSCWMKGCLTFERRRRAYLLLSSCRLIIPVSGEVLSPHLTGSHLFFEVFENRRHDWVEIRCFKVFWIGAEARVLCVVTRYC